MANTHDARRLSKRAFRRRPALMRTTALIFMLLSTLPLAAPLLPVSAMQLPGWLLRSCLAAIAFLCGLTSLLMNGPAVAAARGADTRVFENLRLPRWIITILLASVPAALLYFAPDLVSLFSRYIDQPLADYMKSVLPDGFYTLYLALGALLLIFLAALIGLSWSVFTRQVMIYLFERKDRLRGSAFVQMLRSSLLNAFSPIRIWFSSLGWYLLMGALSFLFSLIARFIAVGWQEGVNLAGQLLHLIKTFSEIPAPVALANYAFSCIWIGGLGFIFWPRYQLKRVYYQRMLMNENGMEIRSAPVSE